MKDFDPTIEALTQPILLDTGDDPQNVSSQPWTLLDGGDGIDANDSDDIEEDMQMFFTGVCMNIVGSLMINLGQTLVKKSHSVILMEGSDPSRKRRYLRAGWTIFCLGNICNFASMAFAPQSTLAALGSVQFIVAPFNAHFILHEPGALTGWNFMAIAFILCGNSLLLLFGSKETKGYEIKDLQEAWYRPPFILYLVFAFGSVVVVMFPHLLCHLLCASNDGDDEFRVPLRKGSLSHGVSRRSGVCGCGCSCLTGRLCCFRARGRPPPTSFLSDSSNSEMRRFGDSTSRSRNIIVSVFEPFLFAYSSAVVGTLGVICAKSLSELLWNVTYPEQFLHWYMYVILVAFPATSTFWLRRMNTGLRLYDAALIIPLFQCNWMALSVFSGGIYFDEFADMGLTRHALFITGVFIVLMGAVLLAIGNFRHAHRSIHPGHHLSRSAKLLPEYEPSTDEDEWDMISISSLQRGSLLALCEEVHQNRSAARRLFGQSELPREELAKILRGLNRAQKVCKKDRLEATIELVEILSLMRVSNEKRDHFLAQVAEFDDDALCLWIQQETGEAEDRLVEASPSIGFSIRAAFSLFQEPQITSTYYADLTARRVPVEKSKPVDVESDCNTNSLESPITSRDKNRKNSPTSLRRESCPPLDTSSQQKSNSSSTLRRQSCPDVRVVPPHQHLDRSQRSDQHNPQSQPPSMKV
eukprot:Rmarinus@m.30051